MIKMIKNYSKAIDIWMLGCDTFVFVAFLEYTMAQYCNRKGNDATCNRKQRSNGELAAEYISYF